MILVTDNMDCFTRFIAPALGLEKIFDKIINSSDLGYLKTEREGETFLACSRALHIPMNRTFLIDDSSETCEFFNSLGGRSFIVKNGIDDTLRFMDDAFKITSNERETASINFQFPISDPTSNVHLLPHSPATPPSSLIPTD